MSLVAPLRCTVTQKVNERFLLVAYLSNETEPLLRNAGLAFSIRKISTQPFSEEVKTDGQNQEFGYAWQIRLEFSLLPPFIYQHLLSR